MLCDLLIADELRPSGGEGEGRPKTTAMVARRMVSSALGIRVPLSVEQRERESRELEAARGTRSHKLQKLPFSVGFVLEQRRPRH